MLKGLQISFLLLLAIAIAAFSAWRYFHAGAWQLAESSGDRDWAVRAAMFGQAAHPGPGDAAMRSGCLEPPG